MFEIIDALTTFDSYTTAIVGVFVVAAAAIIREITDSTGIALTAGPFLLAGALIANFVFRTRFIMVAGDKDTNIVVATAAGIITALVLFLCAIWLSISISEFRSKRQKFMRLPDVPPPR